MSDKALELCNDLLRIYFDQYNDLSYDYDLLHPEYDLINSTPN